MKKLKIVLLASILIIGCSKTQEKKEASDKIIKTETTVIQKEVKTISAEPSVVIESVKPTGTTINTSETEKIAKTSTDKKKVSSVPSLKMDNSSLTVAKEPSAESIDSIISSKVEEKIQIDESSSKAVETSPQEPVSFPEEKSSKGLLFGIGALVAAAFVFIISKRK